MIYNIQNDDVGGVATAYKTGAIRSGKWKYVRSTDTAVSSTSFTEELYNLDVDEGETTDLHTSEAAQNTVMSNLFDTATASIVAENDPADCTTCAIHDADGYVQTGWC